MTLAAADGGRRSRRGFLYQDAVTLLDCLDMLEGHWTEVSWEDLEDILCYQGDAPSYRQVKTVEGAKRHSIADICKPDAAKKAENRTPATSYLGKLFGDKPLPEGTQFTLIVNETPQRDLFQFVRERGGARGEISVETRERIVEKLKGLDLPGGRDVGWCVDRLDVLVTARTCDQVEDEARRRLIPLITAYLGQDPLAQEVDNVLLGLVSGYIARQAAEPQPRKHTVDDFQRILQKSIRHVTGRRPDGSTEPLMTLQAKLRPAGVPEAEAERQHEAMLAFRQAQRRSLGGERERLANLSDKIYAICQLTSMKRRGGLIEAGEPAYRETMLAVSKLPDVVSGAVDLSQALAVLSDITARCQNRYEDAS